MAQDTVKALRLLPFDTANFAGGLYEITDPAAGLLAACFKLRVINPSNVDVFISYDGINLHDAVLADSTADIILQNNSQPNAHVALISKGTHIWVTADAAGVGLVLIGGYYV